MYVEEWVLIFNICGSLSLDWRKTDQKDQVLWVVGSIKKAIIHGELGIHYIGDESWEEDESHTTKSRNTLKIKCTVWTLYMYMYMCIWVIINLPQLRILTLLVDVTTNYDCEEGEALIVSSKNNRPGPTMLVLSEFCYSDVDIDTDWWSQERKGFWFPNFYNLKGIRASRDFCVKKLWL